MSKRVIIAGRGPSLADVNWNDLPSWRVAGINSAFAAMPRCDWTFMVDSPKKVFGSPFDAAARRLFLDPTIDKVLPGFRRDTAFPKGSVDVTFVPMFDRRENDRQVAEGRRELDGLFPLTRWHMKSTLFAIQVLYAWGYREFLMVGHDMKFSDMRPYFDGKRVNKDQSQRTARGLDCVYKALRDIVSRADSLGMRFTCYGTGPLNDIMENIHARDRITA